MTNKVAKIGQANFFHYLNVESNTETSIIVDDYSSRGITLSAWQRFIDDHCGGRAGCVGKTTTDVCNEYLKKLTKDCLRKDEKWRSPGIDPGMANAKGIPYVELMHDLKLDGVGEANVFISHSWAYKFLDVFDTIVHHFSDQPDIYVWFDMFSNNQHLYPLTPEFGWWCNTFKSAIEKIGYVLMLILPVRGWWVHEVALAEDGKEVRSKRGHLHMVPKKDSRGAQVTKNHDWLDPITFHRIWCLFEVYVSIITNCKFEFAMRPVDVTEFVDLLSVPQNRHLCQQLIANINVEEAMATGDHDRDLVLDVIKSDIGVSKV